VINKLYNLTLILLLGYSVNAQESIQWMTFVEAVNKANIDKEARKPLFIDVYTDWCGWCKKMDQTTFADPEMAKFINENFYPVKVDAEMKETIIYNGDTLAYLPNMGRKGTHLLAAKLLGGQMSYPTYVVLDKNFAMVDRIKGYKQTLPLYNQLLNYLPKKAE